jgi:hypothetical protein
MSDQTIFGNEINQQTPAIPNAGSNPNPNQNDALATMLMEIRNEQGQPKYRSVEDALKALKASQEYIPTLKQQLDEKERQLNELKPQVDKITTLEETVRQLTQNQNTAVNQPARVDEEVIANLVNSQLTKVQEQAVQAANIQAVVAKVREQFGEKAEEVFYSKATELGMSKADINALAAKSPSAALAALGIRSEPQKPGLVPGGSVNTAAINPPSNSAIGRNSKPVLIGATSQEQRAELQNAKQMVDELLAQGLTTYDLSNPTVYNKVFKRT